MSSFESNENSHKLEAGGNALSRSVKTDALRWVKTITSTDMYTAFCPESAKAKQSSI